MRFEQLLALGISVCLTACTSILPAKEVAAKGRAQCSLPDFHIDANNPQDALDACTAGVAVSTFFHDLGLMKSGAITLSIVEAIPEENLGHMVLGYFSPGTRHIAVLSFAAATARGEWYGRPMDRALYKSLAAHEIAHALAWSNSLGGSLSIRAREYIAYVVMFVTMDPGHRNGILATASGSGFERDDQIYEGYYYLAPFQFGIDAYRHYLLPGKGADFIRAILRGEVLPVIDDLPG